MIVGRISQVEGVRATATFYERLQPYLVRNAKVMSSPRINSFVKTNVGLDVVVCQIVGEHEIEFDRLRSRPSGHSEPSGSFLVDLEIRGFLQNGVFRSGLRCLPIVGAKVETLETEDLEILHTQNAMHSIQIGSSLFDESVLVRADVNKLMSGHIGIFGNTGSGKSNTLARILREYSLKFERSNQSARVVIFDLNNEYGGDAVLPLGDKAIFDLNTRKHGGQDKIGLDFSLLDEDSWGTMLRATQKTQMPVVRRAYKRWKEFDESKLVERLQWALVDKKEATFFTFRNYCSDFVRGLEGLAFNGTTSGFYYLQSSTRGQYISGIGDVQEISLVPGLSDAQKFYLCLAYEVAVSAESGTNFDYVQPLLPRAQQLINDFEKIFDQSNLGALNAVFADSNFVIVQLGNANSATREMVPSLLTRLILKDAVENKGSSSPTKVTTIVIDEAHNLLGYDSAQNDLVHDNTLRVFEKVVKEGRKFGVYLCAASQRPSDISPTITSQLHSFFIHKLVNPNDIERIRKTVSFMGDSSLSMLSALGQGECIVSGSFLQMPQYVYVDQLPERYRPNSEDVQIFGVGGLIE